MSNTRLEYHEIMQVFADEAEPVAPRVVAKLADLARVKSEAAIEVVLTQVIQLVEEMPLESFASPSYIRQTMGNRAEIVTALRRLKGAK